METKYPLDSRARRVYGLADTMLCKGVSVGQGCIVSEFIMMFHRFLDEAIALICVAIAVSIKLLRLVLQSTVDLGVLPWRVVHQIG